LIDEYLSRGIDGFYSDNLNVELKINEGIDER